MLELFSKYKEIISYLFFGVLTTLVNMVSFYLFDHIMGLHYLLANGFAWILSVLFAFYTNRIFVFGSKSKSIVKEFIKFTSCRLVSGGCDMLIMFIGVDIFHIGTFITKLLTNVVVVIMNYVFSKLFIFTDKENEDAKEY